jgi:hypothetical protein
MLSVHARSYLARIQACVLAVSSALLFAGCTDLFDLNKSALTAGKYSASCSPSVMNLGGQSLSGRDYVGIKDNTYTTGSDFYQGGDCDGPVAMSAAVVATASVTGANKVVPKAVDVTITAYNFALVTFYSQDLTDLGNQMKFCGINDWKASETRNVSGADCGLLNSWLALPANPEQPKYILVKIENNQLQVSTPDKDYDGSTAEKRPTTLGAAVFNKVASDFSTPTPVDSNLQNSMTGNGGAGGAGGIDGGAGTSGNAGTTGGAGGTGGGFIGGGAGTSGSAGNSGGAGTTGSGGTSGSAGTTGSGGAGGSAGTTGSGGAGGTGGGYVGGGAGTSGTVVISGSGGTSGHAGSGGTAGMDGGAGTSGTGVVTELPQGTFVGPCVPANSPTIFVKYVRTTLNFPEGGMPSTQNDKFLDSGCTMLVSTDLWTGSYQIVGQSSNAALSSAFETNMTTSQVTVTFYNASAAAQASSVKYCGVPNWTTGVAKPVAGKVCGNITFGPVGYVSYDLMKFDDTTVQLGLMDENHDLSSPSTRPVELDPYVYTKVATP